MKKTRCFMTVWVAFWLLWPMVFDAVAQQSVEVINYQGELSDLSGPLDGEVEMIFEIFNVKEPGAADKILWSETQSSVEVFKGIFDVKLGLQNPFSADLFDQNDDLFLRITVNGEALTPLQHITSVPYALKADVANYAHTATSADTVLNGTVTGDLQVDGKIGVGSADPVAKFHVVMPEGGSIPSLVPGMIIEDASSNLGSRLEIRDENGTAEFAVDGSGDVLVGGNGKMGIGTSSPDAKLHVLMPNGYLTPATTGGIIITDGSLNSANRLEIQDDTGAAQFVVDGGGRVGIGTDDPETPLEVQGVVSIDGALGIGTTTPQATLEVNGEGQNFPNGFLIIRNNNRDAGIRIYDGNDFADDVKHHIYNANNTTLDALRIAPDGSFEEGGITITQGGWVGIGTTFPTDMLTVNGRTKTNVLEITGGSDLSERFDIHALKEDLLPLPGMVVSIDPKNAGTLMVCSTAYDKKVAGIISGAGGVNPGMLMGQENSRADGSKPVALTGRVYCWADASNGSIEPGDLLTTSHTPGHAMKVKNYEKAQGAILGKAMTALTEKKGLVLVLVTLQ